MAKEELKKEAQEYYEDETEGTFQICEDCYWFADAVQTAYVDSAEPREKQIQIDAEQIRALQKQNGELTDRVKELEKENADLQKSYEELYNSMRVIKDQRNVLEKENVELKDKLKKWKDGIALKDEEIGCIETEFNTFKSEAKEIIREFVEWATWQGNNCPNFKSIQDKAEQFLKDNEVEK